MSNIRVINPWLFFVLIPLIAVVIIGFCLLPKQKKKRPKNIISFVLHLAMCVTLTLAFVDIQFLHTSNNTEVYVLADCSISSEKSAEKMNKLIEDVYTQAGENKGTKVGVVAFGKNQEILCRPGQEFKGIEEMYDTSAHPDFDPTATDLKSALLYTNDLYEEKSVRRMVIVSDGIETDNNAIEALDTLLSNDVHIDAVAVDGDPYDEVAITGLEYVDHAFLGRNEQVKVSIKSKMEGNIQLSLLSEGEILKEEIISVGRGLNVQAFDLKTDEVGTYKYEVKITNFNTDTYEENNHKSFKQDVTDIFNVLYITPNAADRESVNSLGLYPANANITWKIDTDFVPYTIEDLIQYDEIVLSDADISSFDHAEDFVRNLNTVVSVYGKSLMTYGATYSGVANDSYLTDYNDMLPVQYESDEGKAIVLLIDNSGSMSTDDRLGKAKKGCAAIVDNLADRDYLSIVTFSDSAKIVQPLTSAKNKTQIKRAINRITEEGGTEMEAGLIAAGKQIEASKMENKYIITLTDGEPWDQPSDLYSRVKKLTKQGISLSFINISNNTASVISLLKRLAQYGNGSYYYCRSAATLVETMLTAVVNDMDNKAIDCDSPAEISFRAPHDPVLENIPSLPTIDGYNYCRIKSAATTVLTVQYVDQEGDTSSDGDLTSTVATIPLYAYWEFGKGKVSSFTSSISSYWTSGFRNNENGKQFLKNQAMQTLPDRKSDNLLDLSYKNNGVTTTLYVTASDTNKTGRVHVTVTDPKNETAEYDLYYDGKQYTGLIATPEIGEYAIQLDYTYDKVNDDNTTTSVTVDPVQADVYFDYSSEYDLFNEADTTNLYELTKYNGNLTYNEVKYATDSAEIAYKSYNTSMMYFLFISVVLFLADVFIRKSDFKGFKKKAPIAPVNPIEK